MSDITNQKAHREAEKTKAVESYLLNEMTEEQRMRFEEHYFECAACADAVQAGQAFIGGVHPIPEPVPWWKREVPAWRVWALAGATAALLAVTTVGQFHTAPMAMANTIIQAEELTKGPERTYQPKTPSVTVEATLFDSSAFPFYRMDIAGKDNGKTFSQVVPAPPKDADPRLSVQIERQALGYGRFEVTVTGLTSRDERRGPPVETYYFQIDKN
jgi:hypothetical protein